MTESFYEHCLRLLRAGDTKDELASLLSEAEDQVSNEKYQLSPSEAKEKESE